MPPRPVSVDVLAYAPVAFFHCLHCETIWQHSEVRARDRREQLATSLPQELTLEYQRLSDWARMVGDRYGGRVRLRIIDAVSVEGWVKTLRYGVRRYPAVIVDGAARSIGSEFERATELIERRLGPRSDT
jgi:Protein of unknown function (DUF1525)